jgi:hypothetical protein
MLRPIGGPVDGRRLFVVFGQPGRPSQMDENLAQIQQTSLIERTGLM